MPKYRVTKTYEVNGDVSVTEAIEACDTFQQDYNARQTPKKEVSVYRAVGDNILTNVATTQISAYALVEEDLFT
jgi:hypothetical protein